MSRLVLLLLKVIVLVVLTFAFVVLFDRGPTDYGRSFQEEAGRLYELITGPGSLGGAALPGREFEIASLPTIHHSHSHGR